MNETKYFINDFIYYCDKLKMNEHEIYVYNIYDFYNDLKNNYYDFLKTYDKNDDDEIIEMETLSNNFKIVTNWIKSGNDNILVIDTPLDNDMITLIQFDNNKNVIGTMEIQTYYDNLNDEFSKLNLFYYDDVFQLFNIIYGFHIYDGIKIKNFTLKQFTKLLHNVLKIMIYRCYNYIYCFAPKNKNNMHYETSIYDNVDVFKKYYISICYDNIDTNDINQINKMFDTLETFRNKIIYIHWYLDDFINIVCDGIGYNEKIIYDYNIVTGEIIKIKNAKFINYMLWDVDKI